MRKNFASYLVSCGYTELTPSGNPSTVYDYCRRIETVAREEGMSWEELAENMDEVLPQYDDGGCRQQLGRKSHRAVINALKRFSEFVRARKE